MKILSNYIRKLAVICLLLQSTYAFAAQFIASVPSALIEMGQSIELSLTLKDASAKGAPELGDLNSDFTIYSQQQYSTFSSVNGAVTTEAGWDIVMIPNRQGELVIPSLKINTNKGVMATAPIKIQVVAAGSIPMQKNNTNSHNSLGGNSSASTVNQDNIGVSLVATTNKSRAYVKEPIVYTLKIISYRPINNVVLEDIKANDAIIDKVGQPKQYEQTVGGLRAHIIELKYYITPLVAGKINIKPAVIRGEVYTPSPNISRSNHFGMFNNFFMDDPLQFKPFTVRGDGITLTTQAPAVPGKNWMPLHNLTLSEEWSGLENAQVGSTITRKIKIVATGGFSNQLPSFKQSMEMNSVKTYADSPVFNDEVKPSNELIVGTKEETFTIVPVQAGKITFPEIKIKWWNLNTKQSEVTSLHSKTIDILPGANTIAHDSTVDFAAQDSVAKASGKVSEIFKHDNLLYVLIACLIAVILILFAAIAYLIIRKQPLILDINSKKPNVKRIKKNIAKVKQINSAVDARNVIIQYAIEHWHAPANLTLNKLGTYLTDNNYSYDLEVYVLLCRNINADIYATVGTDLQIILDAWESFKNSVVKNNNSGVIKPKSDYVNLNPT